MDPDIPIPSVETNTQTFQSQTQFHSTPQASLPFATKPAGSSNNLRHSSPLGSPRRSPLPRNLPSSPRQQSPSPSAANRAQYVERPLLHHKKSTDNLTAMRSSTPSKLQYRRSSSNLNPSTPLAAKASPETSRERPKSMTPASVASDFFRQELEHHTDLQTEVVVVVHDSCYGHRFSRPRTSKGALSTIVERPERIHATLLGVSTAYVRIGGCHAKGRHAPHPERSPDSTTQYPFRIHKTSRNLQLNHPAVTHVHGAKWMEELQIMCDSAESKLAMNGKELVRPIGYGKDESGRALPKLHEGDLYLCAESLAALQGCLGGVCDAVDTVFTSETTRRAFVCIRPPGHHCSSDFPSGFCWLNNVHVGITYAAMTHGLTHAAIIDFDLHHGDGSQMIAWDHNRKQQSATKNSAPHKKTAIGYYSLHDINSYPCEWGDEEKVRNASLCIENAHGQSIWNVHLEPWKDLQDFWRLYETRYQILLEKTRLFLRHHTARLRSTGHIAPKAAIFLSAGFDASQWEGEGMQRHNVNVPTEFYAQFTADVVQMAREPDLAVDGRVISVLEGGYSNRALTSGTLSHICGLSGHRSRSTQQSNMELDGTNDINAWWTAENLEALENIVSGNKQPELPKAIPEKLANSYSSPTQASTAKMTEVARERRSLSAQLDARLIQLSRPRTPPPEVDWVTASYELSRLIIPSDRQTRSCTHEELNAEATKVRRDRQSAIGLPESMDEKMQLRGRKPKESTSAIDRLKTAPRTSNRRTTIAAVSELPDPTFGQSQDDGKPRQRSRRRSSASSILSGFQDMKIGNSDQLVTNSTIVKPTQSASSRLSSVQPERVPKAAAVRKPRAAPFVAPATRVRSSPRKPAIPPARAKQSSSRSSTAEPLAASSSPMGSSSPLLATQSDQAQQSRENGNDLDGITNAMKKISIKLNVPTPEEHAAKLKTTEDEKVKKVRPTKKPAVPKPVRKPVSSVTGLSNTIKAQLPQGNQITNLTSQAVVIDTMPGPSSGPIVDQVMEKPAPRLPSISHVSTMDMSDVSNSGLTHSTSGTVQPVQPGAANQPSGVSTAAPSSIMPPPSQIRFGQPSVIGLPSQHIQAAPGQGTSQLTKNTLPLFTSTSPIPFASSTAAENDFVTKQEANPNSSTIWDVPETPQR